MLVCSENFVAIVCGGVGGGCRGVTICDGKKLHND